MPLATLDAAGYSWSRAIVNSMSLTYDAHIPIRLKATHHLEQVMSKLSVALERTGLRERKPPYERNLIIHNKVIFCPVPKVACTNWKMTFRRAAGFSNDKNIDIHDRRWNGLTYLRDRRNIMRFIYLMSPKYTRAVFVRNPWTRILSAYRDKIERATELDSRNSAFIHRAVRDAKRFCVDHGLIEDGLSQKPTFGEFLSYLES